MKRHTVPALLTTLFLLTACSADTGEGDFNIEEQPPPFAVIGHRGAPLAAAENTIAAFDAAVDEGSNALEIDICITSDDVVVVWHDRNPDDKVALARQAGLEKLLYIPWVPNLGSKMRRETETLTLAELREHYGYAKRGGLLSAIFTEGERDPDARIPTLLEFAEWGEQEPALRYLFLDVKLGEDQTDLARAISAHVADMLLDTHYEVFLMSPYEKIVQAMRGWYDDNMPNARVRYIFDHEKEGALAATRRLDLDAISTGKTVLRSWKGYIEEIEHIMAQRDRVMPVIDPVISWTIDDAEEMELLVEAGVDGIMTNKPADLARVAEGQ